MYDSKDEVIKGFSDLNSGDIAFSANRNELNFYKNNSN